MGQAGHCERLVYDLDLCDEWSMHLSDLLGALGDCGHQVSRAALEYRRADDRRLDQIHEAIRTGALEWLLDITADRVSGQRCSRRHS